MSASLQLIQLDEEKIVEVSGFSALSGIYLENTELDISVSPAGQGKNNTIQLSITPNSRADVLPFSFEIEIIAHRITLAQLVNGSSLVVVPAGVDINLSDSLAIKAALQKSGGIWLDRLPKECIREIIKHCSC